MARSASRFTCMLFALAVPALAVPALADGGGGGGGGDGSALGALDQMQRTTEESNRNLRTLDQQGRQPARPRPAPAAQTPGDQRASIPGHGEVFTPVGTRWIPDFPGGPTGWISRHTLPNGWRIYFYRNGSTVAIGPRGEVVRSAAR